MKRLNGLLIFLLALTAPAIVSAQEPDLPDPTSTSEPAVVDSSENPIHQSLRKLHVDVEKAIASGEWESLKPLLTSQVVVTWLDGTQSHGHVEVMEYLNSKTGGPNPIVDSFLIKTEVTSLSDLYGEDTAVAYGNATSSFVLRGREVSMSGPWSATMVHDDDGWKLAAITASVGAFDNPILTWTWRLVWIVGIIAGVVGIVIGWLLRRPQKATV